MRIDSLHIRVHKYVNYNASQSLCATTTTTTVLLSRRAEIIGPPHCPRDRYFVVVKLIIKLYRTEAAGGGATKRNKRFLQFSKEKDREREIYMLYEAICQSSHALPRSSLSRLLVYRDAAECFNQQLLILRGAIGASVRVRKNTNSTSRRNSVFENSPAI